MSFKFNQAAFEDNSFNEQIRDKLTRALNPGNFDSSEGSSGTDTNETSRRSKKLDILKSGITVRQVNFRNIPQLEILDLDVSGQSKSLLKGICKISCKDAMLQITTEIEANLLLLSERISPGFTMPKLISNDSFTVPITMTFDHIELEAITNIFVKNTGVGISFNDVNLDFQFQCSMKLLQSSIEKRLKESMQSIFKDVLPSVIFNMSQRWFINGSDGNPEASMTNSEDSISDITPKTILDDVELQDFSPATMLRLSTLISSRQSLSLNLTSMNTASTIPGCLERQNLRHFSSRIPSLNNYYSQEVLTRSSDEPLNNRQNSNTMAIKANDVEYVENSLPKEVLDSGSYDVKTIANIQTRIYERNKEEKEARRRKIRFVRRKKSGKENSTPSKATSMVSDIDSPLEPLKSPVLQQVTPTSLRPSTSPISSGISASLQTPTPLLSPHPVVAVSPNNVLTSISLPEDTADTSLVSTNNIPSLTLPQAQINKEKIQIRLNLLEESYFRNEFKDLRNSLYSPMRNQRFYVQSEDGNKPSLLDAKRFSFVGLANQQIKWGNDDLPPPYAAN